MNHDYGITREVTNEQYSVLFVDTKKARWFDKPWRSLSEFQKRKFENVLFMKFSRTNKLKFVYV